jgi:hypothetical protein
VFRLTIEPGFGMPLVVTKLWPSLACGLCLTVCMWCYCWQCAEYQAYLVKVKPVRHSGCQAALLQLWNLSVCFWTNSSCLRSQSEMPRCIVYVQSLISCPLFQFWKQFHACIQFYAWLLHASGLRFFVFL